MLPALTPWPRPLYAPRDARMEIHFVCFARGELRELPLNSALFGLPDPELVKQVDVRVIRRSDNAEWYKSWWQKAFATYAQQALGERFSELTESDSCTSIRIDSPDREDLAALQTAWGLTRWCVERGASVVLDFPALRFRTAEQISRLSFDALDIQREIQLVVAPDPGSGSSLLLHSRGLGKFARPELLARALPADRDLLARALNRIALAFAEGLLPERVRLRMSEQIELVTRPCSPESTTLLGVGEAVEVVRADGLALDGLTQALSA